MGYEMLKHRMYSVFKKKGSFRPNVRFDMLFFMTFSDQKKRTFFGITICSDLNFCRLAYFRSEIILKSDTILTILSILVLHSFCMTLADT